MNIKYIIGSIFLSLLTLLSCNDEEWGLQTQGYLELGVTKNIEVITRSFDVEDQSLAVDICMGANDSIVKHFDDYNSMAGERVLREVGTYKVKVTSNENEVLDFEEPTFYGEVANVAITAGKTTPVSVECLLSCVKVTTEFTSPVKSKFKSCVARVSDKSGASLDYSMTETRAGYFQPDYIMVDLTVENKEGLTFKMSKLIENTEARDHYHLVFDLVESGNNNSGMDFDISIDTDANEETHTVTIPLPETGYGQDAPEVQFVGTNNEVITTLTFDKGDPQTLMAKVSSENIGLNSVTLLATSPLFEEQGLPTSLKLLNLSEEDKTKLNAIGLTIPTLEDNKKPFDIDFSTMVSTYLPGGAHTFTIVARDEMGHETQPQTISITVNTEVNTHQVITSEVWAHYATLRGYVKNATQEQAGTYKFQYKKSADGDDAWQDVAGSVTVGENGNSNVTQVVTNLEDNTEYEYRLVVNDSPAETMMFTTEEARQLTNSGFEDWYTNSDNLPKPSANSGSVFWDCGNSKAFGIFTAIMTTADSGEKTEGSFSAKMESKETANILGAGNIFTGSFSLNGANGRLSLGRDFSSRPNKLTGDYKYISSKVTSAKGHLAEGADDECSIYIALTTSQITIDTGEKIYFNVNDPAIIAYGALDDSKCKTTDGFESFEINLEYRSSEKPLYIIVVASSSKYGDYFEGGNGSTMWLDNLKLVYDNKPNAE